MPLHIGNGWQMLGIALLHAALALALLGWRWRRQALQDDLPQPV
jgi:membrane protein implicated in regulation of membrane protease activity